jgi:hypothetical protein
MTCSTAAQPKRPNGYPEFIATVPHFGELIPALAEIADIYRTILNNRLSVDGDRCHANKESALW